MSKKKIAFVVRAIDGDTIEIRYQNYRRAKVRLIGVNTPESRDVFHKKKEPFGIEVKEFTKKTLYPGRKIFIETDKDPKDMYDRTLAYVWLDEEVMYNQLLLEKGFARVYTWMPNNKYEQLFIETETGAYEERRGIWTDEYFTRNHRHF